MRGIGVTGLAVAPIGIDGGVFGLSSGSRAALSMLDAFRDAGGNLIYTADHYAGGRSEFIIGSWLRTLRDRSQVVVATTIGRHPDALGLSPRMVVRAADASLRRLDTDHIDLLIVDGDDVSVPLDDTLEALDMLARAGKTRHVAVINHSAARIRAIQARATEARYPPVTAVLQEYSLMARHVFEGELAPAVAETGAAFFARRPIAHGFLTGEYRDRGAHIDSPLWARALDHVDRRGLRILDRLAAVSAAHDVSLARTAASWVLSKPGVTAALVAPRSTEELLDIAQAPHLALTRSEVSALDEVSES